MTTLLDPPGTRPFPPRRPQPPVLVAAAAGIWAAALGIVGVTVLVLLGWIGSEHDSSSTSDAFRAALRVWLGAHRATFDVHGAPLTLLPLGLSLLPFTLLHPAGRAVGRSAQLDGLRDVGRCVAALSVAYTCVVAVLSPLGSSGGVTVHAAPAVWWALLASATGSAVGMLRSVGLGGAAMAAIPPRVRVVLAAAVAGLAAVLASSAALLAAVLVGHLVQAGDLASRLEPGWFGGALLFCLGAAYLPTLLLWTAALVVGPGFVVGTGAAVSITGVSLGEVPGFPLLSVLPSELPRAALALPLLVVAAGVVVGLIVARRLPEASGRDCVLLAAAAGAVAGCALGVLASMSAGALGSNRMATLGPSGWLVAALASVEIGGAAALTMGVVRWRATRSGAAATSRRPAEQE